MDNTLHVWRCCQHVLDASVAVTQHQIAAWRCVVSLSLLRIVKSKCFVFFQILRDLVGCLKRTKWKNEYAQSRRLRREINSSSKSEVFPTWVPLPNPKEIRASPSKSTSFQIHSSKCSFKTAFFQTSIFKFYLLSPISALLLPTRSTLSFHKLVEKV